MKQKFRSEKVGTEKYKGMSKEDIAELERQEADTVFAKGGAELLGGTVAGVEQDENGNITLDPEKFIMGALGVSTLRGFKKFYDKSPKTQFKVKKALRNLAKDSTRVAGDMLEKINKQLNLDIEPKIVADVKVPKKDRMTKGNLKLFNGDTDKVARERFDIQSLEKISKAGRS